MAIIEMSSCQAEQEGKVEMKRRKAGDEAHAEELCAIVSRFSSLVTHALLL
jgi:hypothetical protein